MHDDAPKRVLVTSGPTRAYFDRIRYIANTSSGALGARIVESLAEHGIPVLHMYGRGSQQASIRPGLLVEPEEIATVDGLIEGIGRAVREYNIAAVVHAMAVLDYVPSERFDGKKASGDAEWTVTLKKTPKVIEMIADMLPEACVVGFKLESGIAEDELVRRASALLHRHGLAMVVANLLEEVTPERHKALLVGPGGHVLGRAATKHEIAGYVADFIAARCGF